MSYVTYKGNTRALGQAEEEKVIPHEEFIKRATAEAMKSGVYASGEAVFKKMFAREQELVAVLGKLKGQFDKGITTQVEYDAKRIKVQGFIDSYRKDMLELNAAQGAFLRKTLNETAKELIKEGYTVPWKGELEGMGVLITGTILAIAVVAAVTAAVKIAGPVLRDIVLGKIQVEREREKVVADALKEILKGVPPEKRAEVIKAYKAAQPKKVRLWYEYLFWAGLLGGGALAAVKLAPMAMKLRRGK